jgi:hypothetical protein
VGGPGALAEMVRILRGEDNHGEEAESEN